MCLATKFLAMAIVAPPIISFLFFVYSICFASVRGNPNYGDALEKSILFFQGQRSGRLPPDQQIKWRSNSGLSDGSAANVDLTGGYYDAGDNVKFGFPMAFTTTMLSWGVVEFGGRMGGAAGPARLAAARAAGGDAEPGRVVRGRGDPGADHRCWERAEDMDTPRSVYAVSAAAPGSDVAGETAAALAAAALALRGAGAAYARRLIAAAERVMALAVRYQGKYSDALGGAVCPYYCSYSGYNDELLWGAAWLYKATNNASYLSYLRSLGANDITDIFSWDNKFAGARVLLSRVLVMLILQKSLVDKDKSFQPFRYQAEDFMCRIGGDLTCYRWFDVQTKFCKSPICYIHKFLAHYLCQYMISSNHTFTCGNTLVTPKTLRALAKKQVDYILGENPLKMSYMVGYGTHFPQRIHHRGSSLPSLASHLGHIGCQAGFQYFMSSNPNPNILTGAVVGGPNQNDAFSDDRSDYSRSEPATYINAPLVGTLAYLAGSYGFAAVGVSGTPDYRDALTKSLVFFEGQRSGKLPPGQTLNWRGDSGLSDGSAEHVDLTGGYYDAGDNIKFGFPMAFTTTMLAWSVLEFGRQMPKELDHAREAVRWGTDYLLKASSALPDALYVQVGNPNEEHKCWERAGDMSTSRPVYKVTSSNPGSDIAAETAAALAAASLVFRHADVHYSNKLKETAVKAFAFADKYRGSYSDSLSSVDELLWGAAWLYKATKNSSYLSYAKSLGINSDSDSFSWDNKIPGACVLLSRDYLVQKNEEASEFREQAERFMCSVLPNSSSMSVKYTPGGLLYKMNGSNMQYVTTTSFLLSVYSKYLKASKQTFKCDNLVVTPAQLRVLVKKQVDYILGENPRGMSYMVGYGENFPRRIHHRDSSIPTIRVSAEAVGCDGGFPFLYSDKPNPNILTGAVVGGPDENDNFADDRNNYAESEPAIYINAPLVGALSYLAANFQH
ncbi:Endoglucanase 1 [Ananas comosus]|uniref:Endoglucanase n=1 Tax=Ananas comosus TaxID=4615 RepID=A0A199V3T8_ANACO|nr:Endoglucanase 1 [Ananas comosus]